MSFTGDVKEELSKQTGSARHCQIAEIAAIMSACGHFSGMGDGRGCIKIQSENAAVIRKYFTLVKKTFNINTNVAVRQNMSSKRSRIYTVSVEDCNASAKILQAAKILHKSGENESLSAPDNTVIWQTCCKRAFLRGAFLAAGSVNAPEKDYHFEIAFTAREKAEQIQNILKSFGIDSKIIMRKKYYVAYIKEGTQIVDILNIMEAHVALMKFENERIIKEIRNSVNRKFNCETANINKTVLAAVQQKLDIEYIRDTVGLDGLSDSLRDMALIRLERPEASLKELGEALEPPVGKSGVNHRLRKLSNIADTLKEERGEM